MLISKVGRDAVRKLSSHPCVLGNIVPIGNEVKNFHCFAKRNISFTRVHLTHYLEDYYTCPEIATNMISPMSEYVWWSWLFLQGAIVFGTLFHSNYYFTGKPLPKVQGNSQLCEDSW
ncbi:conserved Plasmodium protein, unknown function [Plasmodium ovale]|uniref:Uncharacterized protein n=1 Tax=Plasmodium ovale TaxID=36330 RepID=A0A1D3TG35_PLAOA|nr:conserved Plasmodium protein, unknown function [Plasmodium ovale]